MDKKGLFGQVRRGALLLLICGGIAASAQLPVRAAGRATLAWDASGDPNVAGYVINYGVASRSYTNSVCVGNQTSGTISNLVEGITYFFAARAYNNASVQSDFSNEATYLVPASVNQPPTLNPISDVTINENAATQTVKLSGITAGAANESQTLTFTAVSSDPALIPNPTIVHTRSDATAKLVFQPAAYAFGRATVTVTVNDGAGINNSLTRTFAVTVQPVNQPPTLDPLNDVTINDGDPRRNTRKVALSGLTVGAPNERQKLSVIALSSNPGLIPNPTISYTNPATSGTLSFTPVAGGSGTARLIVIVGDGGDSNSIVTRSFNVAVLSVNQRPTLDPLSDLTIIDGERGFGARKVTLSGITSGAPYEDQKLAVVAVSGNPGLIPNPTVSYISPNVSGTLSFASVPGVYGTARLTVIVGDGGASNNIVTRSFNVAVGPVNQPPTLDPINDVAIIENAGVQSVPLSGIHSGATNEFQPLSISAVSSNPELIPNPTVDYTSPNSIGSLSFTPVTDAFGGATITVTVHDGSAVNGTITRSFWFGINARVAQLSIGSTVLQAGRGGSVPVNFSSSEGVTDLNILLDVPPGHLTNLALQALAPEINPDSATIVPRAGTTALLHLAARPGQSILGFRQVAQLSFTAIANQQSAFVPINALPFSVTKANGSPLTGRPAQSGRVVIVGQEALLEATLDASGNRGLVLYGKPASTFAIEYTTSLSSSATWTRLTPGFPITTLATPVQLSGSLPDLVLYRAAKLSSP